MADDKLKWRISPEQILEAMRFYTAAELKSKQTKMSAAATELERLTEGPLRNLLNENEEAIIRQAADLVRQLNSRVEHAKEIKKREEKRKEADRKRRAEAVQRAIRDAYPDQLPEGADLHSWVRDTAVTILALNQCNQILLYLPVLEPAGDMQAKLQRYIREGGAVTMFARYLRREITSALDDPLYAKSEDQPPAEALRAMMERIAPVRDQVRAKYPSLFDELERLLLIESSENVERLPVKPKR